VPAPDAGGSFDAIVVGAGIVGLAVARRLARDGRSVCVLERHETIGTEQTGHNSGVIHAGVYYAPGSLKARLCVEGARRLYEYCDERGIPYERCGKLIVARDASELPALDELERRATANGVPGLRRLAGEEIAEVEPHCVGQAALHSPNTGIVDFGAVARSLARDVEEGGGRVRTGARVDAVTPDDTGVVVRHGAAESRARFLVSCAGLWSDRMAVLAGADSDPRIVPFRGAYLRLRPEKRELVRGLIYPVPDPSLPFLGVHLTRHMDGEVSLGPTALLAPRARSLAWPGTWRMARRWWRTGLTEMRNAARVAGFARQAAQYVPELEPSDFSPYFAGYRAQALGRDGSLVDDFVVHETGRALHVRNAPSPAATSSLAIADAIADRAQAALA
jgi:(S)-2-hydroxyglutarate dehydrogenase